MDPGRTMSKDEAEQLTKRKASSHPGLSYSPAVPIHVGPKKRVMAIAHYIERSAGSVLSLKLETSLCSKKEWTVSETQSLTLDDAAARKLLDFLQKRLALAEEKNGAFIVIPVTGGRADLQHLGVDDAAKAVRSIFENPTMVRYLADLDFTSAVLDSLRGAVRLAEVRSALAELRTLLDTGVAKESAYQEWCSKHGWAFGHAYVDHDRRRRISAGDDVDFLLPTTVSGLRDVVELKRPDMPVIQFDEAHKSSYFSTDVSKAIGQCHRYLDVLHEEAGNGLRDHREIVAYHPRATIIIGRSNDWDAAKHRALHGLNARLSNITVMTYDQLLAQGERLLNMLDARDAEPDDRNDGSASHEL